MKACEMCGDWSATQMVRGEDLCVECATRVAKTLSAGRRASSLGRDYDELALMVEERDAEITRLRAELEQARVQLAGCLCAAEGTGDADKVRQGDFAWTPALQKTVELRAELAAMTARKDGWREAALMYRSALRFTNVDYEYHMRAWSTLRRNDRLEDRNG